MRRWLLVLIVAAGAWDLARQWQLRAVHPPPGVLAHREPEQSEVAAGEVPDLQLDGYTLHTLARYSIEARILGRERYRWHREAELSPLDFALGWGPMSDSAVLDRLEVSQSSRYFTVRWDAAPPLPPEQMFVHAANVHLVPAAAVRDPLLAMRPGQLVALRGRLIEATAADGFRWRSSLVRTDTGAGACELMYVESARVLR